jgi:hypothetical protein
MMLLTIYLILFRISYSRSVPRIIFSFQLNEGGMVVTFVVVMRIMFSF